MTRTTVAGGAFATIVGLFALASDHWNIEQNVDPPPAMTPSTTQGYEGLLYGRVTTEDGDIYEGRLRFGGDEEGLWGNYFNGFKDENPWVAYVPSERLPKERLSVEGFGLEIAWKHQADLGRPFMARFGDIARIDARGRDLQVTLRSGTRFDLDRYAADDFADGIRVWDRRHGVVDLDEWRIRTIEFLPSAGGGAAPYPLYGTVHTRHGDFTGFIQWNREACLGSDELEGHTAEGALSLRFATIRSIARRSPDSVLVTLLDGREVVLSETPEVGNGNAGIYVDDPRYGRVLISWDAFERVDFGPGGTGPAYGDFPAGRPLTGSVITRSDRQFSGWLVYDLDESETTETLDAPAQGVDYTIPFGLISSIALPSLDKRGSRLARVSLRSGGELQLELTGDLDERNAGMLIFSGGHTSPEYVPWTDVEKVELDGPPEV